MLSLSIHGIMKINQIFNLRQISLNIKEWQFHSGGSYVSRMWAIQDSHIRHTGIDYCVREPYGIHMYATWE